MPELRTERLLLRHWRPEDREPFAKLNADPEVREHFPGLQSREESDASVQLIEAGWSAEGFGLWAVEIPGVAPFIGFAGLFRPTFEASFTPCVEIAWRLAKESWGRGYATEAAQASQAWAFENRKSPELVSFTVPANHRSIRVMQKIGMTFAGEFAHPAIPAGHPLRRHVLYKKHL